MLTIEKILPKRILGIYTSGINELDFQFLLRRKYKDQTVSILFCKDDRYPAVYQPDFEWTAFLVPFVSLC